MYNNNFLEILGILAGTGTGADDTTPVPAVDPGFFGPELDHRDHPMGIGDQWIGTVNGAEVSIVYSRSGHLAPAGSYELGYKVDDEWSIFNSFKPQDIIEHLDILRGPVDDTS